MARPTGDPSVVPSFKPAGPAFRKQLHLKRPEARKMWKEDADFNDTGYINDTVYIVYIEY